MPTVAQVRFLTLLDDMPPQNAVVCTSNCKVTELESRFQRRFQVVTLQAPKGEEIERFLLSRWPSLGETNSRWIGVACGGNVGQALMDAQTRMI